MRAVRSLHLRGRAAVDGGARPRGLGRAVEQLVAGRARGPRVHGSLRGRALRGRLGVERDQARVLPAGQPCVLQAGHLWRRLHALPARALLPCGHAHGGGRAQLRARQLLPVRDGALAAGRVARALFSLSPTPLTTARLGSAAPLPCPVVIGVYGQTGGFQGPAFATDVASCVLPPPRSRAALAAPPLINGAPLAAPDRCYGHCFFSRSADGTTLQSNC